MAAPVIDWKDATVKVSVLVHQTATSERQEVEFPLAALFERFERLEAALAGAVTAIEVVADGGSTMRRSWSWPEGLDAVPGSYEVALKQDADTIRALATFWKNFTEFSEAMRSATRP